MTETRWQRARQPIGYSRQQARARALGRWLDRQLVCAALAAFTLGAWYAAVKAVELAWHWASLLAAK